MPDENAGIKIRLIIPTNIEIDEVVKQVQQKLNAKTLSIKLNIDNTSLDNLSKMSTSAIGDINSLKQSVQSLQQTMSKLNKESVVEVKDADGLVKERREIEQLETTLGHLIETTRIYKQGEHTSTIEKDTTDYKKQRQAIDDLNASQLKLIQTLAKADMGKSFNTTPEISQKIASLDKSDPTYKSNKKTIEIEIADLEKYRKQIESNRTAVQRYYDSQVADSQKLVSQRQREIEQLKQQTFYHLNSGNVIDEKQLQYEQKLKQTIKERAMAEQKASENTAHWLNLQQMNFDSSLIKFRQQKSGLFDENQLNSLQQNFSKLTPTTENLRQKVQSLQAEFKRLDAEAIAKGFNSANKSAISFTSSITTAAFKMGIWLGVGNLIFGSISQLQQGVSIVNELNKATTNIAMITGKSREEIQGMTQDYIKLASSLHDTTTSVMQASEEFLRAGHNQKETLELVQASTVMSKIAGQDQKQTADQLIAITNGYKMNIDETMSVVDKLTTVDNASATSTSELGTALERTSASAQMAGTTFDQLVSYIATVSSVSRKSASTIGESFKVRGLVA